MAKGDGTPRPTYENMFLIKAGVKLPEGHYSTDFKEKKLSEVEVLMNGCGLYWDYNNEPAGLLLAIHCVTTGISEKNTELPLLKQYEERFRDQEIFTDFCLTKRIMELSNPEYIQKLDVLVDEINKRIIIYSNKAIDGRVLSHKRSNK